MFNTCALISEVEVINNKWIKKTWEINRTMIELFDLLCKVCKKVKFMWNVYSLMYKYLNLTSSRAISRFKLIKTKYKKKFMFYELWTEAQGVFSRAVDVIYYCREGIKSKNR